MPCSSAAFGEQRGHIRCRMLITMMNTTKAIVALGTCVMIGSISRPSHLDFTIKAPSSAVSDISDIHLDLTIKNNGSKPVDFSDPVVARAVPLITPLGQPEQLCIFDGGGLIQEMAFGYTPPGKSFHSDLPVGAYRCRPFHGSDFSLRVEFNIAPASQKEQFIYSNSVSFHIVDKK